MENVAMLFRADEIDYNEDTGDVQARGNVYFEQFERNEKIWADHLEYNTKTEAGKFYDVRGTTAPRIDTRPGMLTSTNPYYFQGKWAERVEGHYILYNGFLTNCRIPNPWWRLKGPRFNVVPQESARAYRSVFLLRKFPLFYTPFFYKSLEKVPRRTGLLMPNIGHSSTRGFMLGVGAFWAINRSYDATYHVQDYSARGFAHHLELRGKPTDKADFDAILFRRAGSRLGRNPTAPRRSSRAATPSRWPARPTWATAGRPAASSTTSARLPSARPFPTHSTKPSSAK